MERKTPIRVCGNCRALEYKEYKYQCTLGFNTTGGLVESGGKIIGSSKIRPVGDDGICPKPLTVKRLVDILLEKDRKGN